MTRICLDTSAYSGFRRGDPELVRVLVAATWVGVPAVVLGELRAGFRLGSLADRNERELEDFLGEPVVHVLPVDEETSLHYAEIVLALRRAGTPLPTNDVWIAATAAGAAAPVVTCDAHFRSIERVRSIVVDSGAKAGTR